MRKQLVLKSVVAFCLTLAVGRFLFPKAPVVSTAKPAPAVTTGSPVAQVSTVPDMVVKDLLGKKPLPERKIDRNFKEVKEGMITDNDRMTHLLFKNYAEGVMHRAIYQFNSSVRWIPESQELQRGKDTLAVLGKMKSSTARLEKAGEFNRVVYPDTYTDTDERMSIRRDGGMEHDIVLRKAPAGLDDSKALAYTGRLQLSKELSMWDGKKQIPTTGTYITKNDVHFKNHLGNVIFNLRSPVAYDAKVSNLSDTDAKKQADAAMSGATTPCLYRFDFDDSGVKLSIVTPGAWLTDYRRSYPVVIDPNFGPFGLADGDPPIYVGTAGADTIIPANAGGTPIRLVDTCPFKPDNGYGYIQMPFDFEYYNIVHNHLITNPVPLNTGVLKVHIDGFASWTQPAVYPFTPNPCQDTDNVEIPTPGYPDNAMFAYWDDLRYSTIQGANMYWFVDGTAPLRRLVIEWYKMGYSRGSNNEVITFNLILYECENKIQMIIGQIGETERGLSSIGIENVGGTKGIQYEFNSALLGSNFNLGFNQNNPFNQNQGGAVNNGQNTQPITPGTSVAFQHSALGQIKVTNSGLSGCIPLTVCYSADVVVPPSTCDLTTVESKAFGFQWTYDSRYTFALGTNNSIRDGAVDFTADVCHAYTSPGNYVTELKISDEFGATATQLFDVTVCDTPSVVLTASPQGGVAPLIVDLNTFYEPTNLPQPGTQDVPTSPMQSNIPPNWQVDRMVDYDPLADTNTNTAPPFVTLGTLTAGPTELTAHFDTPGVYRVTATFDGGVTGFGVGSIFIFVAAPTDVIEDSLVITESQMTIDWTGKVDANGDGKIDNAENDTLFVRGYVSLPGVQQSDLLGRRVRLVLNGSSAVFDGIFDAEGNASFNDVDLNRTGSFHLKLPSGAFTCNVQRSLYTLFGVANANEARLLPAMFGLTIEGLFPTPPQTGTALITYDYRSHSYVPLGQLPGSAKGTYRFGSHSKSKVVVDTGGQEGRTGGFTIIQSGVFFVTQAKIKLLGNNVIADMRGLLARYGGDSLRPQDSSDVVVSLGGFSEALNFTSTSGFKTSGKPPALTFNYKRDKSLGTTGIAQLSWQDRSGNFRIKTNPIPNELVGINPALATQILQLGLKITPDGSQVYDGATRFQIVKKSPTDFVRNAK